MGISAYSLTHGLGFYTAIRYGGMLLSHDNMDYYETISVEKAETEYGDDCIEKGEGSFTLDAGFTQLISNPLYLYAGLGYTWTWGYRGYYDPFEILGTFGRYWIDDPEKRSSGINGFAGLILIIHERISLNMGYTSNPAGVNFGISYVTLIRYR